LKFRILLAVLCLIALVPAYAEDRAVRIALLSDTHTNRGATDDLSRYKVHLHQVIEAVNKAGVDLVLVAGDLTQDGKPEEFEDFKAQIRGFRAPVLFVPGNHDVGGKRLPNQSDGITAERLARYEQAMGPSFYGKTVKGVRIIGVNASLLGSGLDRESKLWEMLDKELSRPQSRPVLLFMHYPLFLKSPEEAGGDYWNIEPEPRKQLLSLISKGGVRTVLTAHLHRPLINHLDKMLLYTTPPVSFGLPKEKQPEGWSLITVPKSGEVTAEFYPIAD
jgi:3',5'-cyclic AMP phosphodiesterase CpdA